MCIRSDYMSSEEVLLVIVVGILFFVLGVVFYVIPKARQAKENAESAIYGAYSDHSPEKEVSVMAVIKNKRTGLVPNVGNVNYILFEISDGSRMEFAIRDAQVFSTLLIGDTGLLRYYSNFYINFDIEKERTE